MGLKAFVLGVTIAVCVWALALSTPFQIVAAIFCVIGAVLFGAVLYIMDK